MTKRTFTYKTWGGALVTVEADRVEFTPTHVVFWDNRTVDGVLVLAERPENVNHLTQVAPLPTNPYQGSRRLGAVSA